MRFMVIVKATADSEARREALSRQMAALQKQMEPLQERMSRLSGQMAREHAKVDASREPMKSLHARMAELTKPMEEFGRRMGQLGREQGRLSREAVWGLIFVAPAREQLDLVQRDDVRTPLGNPRRDECQVVAVLDVPLQHLQ